MTELVFHIGDHKTGSSSIQLALLNRNWASDTISIAYPSSLSAAQMAKTLYKPARHNEREQKWSEMVDFLIEADAAQANFAVLSAEHFSHVDPKLMADNVRKFFPDYAAKTRYIAYLRPHPGSLLSHYAQQTKCGSSIRSLERMCTVSLKNRFFVFAPRVAAWRAQFGDRYSVHPMIKSQLDAGDVVQDFLSVVARGASIRTEGVKRTNEALTVQQLAAVRELQAVLRKRGIAPKMRVSVGQHLGHRLAKAGAMGGDSLKLSKSVAEKIALHLREDAAEVDDFLGGEPLFVSALSAAVDTATEGEQSNMLADYAPPAAVTEIRKLARTLVGQLTSPDGMDWKKMHHASRGQSPKNIPQNSGGANRIQDTLDQVLQTITSSISPKPA